MLRLPSSFRDPSGFVFQVAGRHFRQVNRVYARHYDHLVASGLYEALTEEGLMVAHQEADAAPCDPSIAYKILEPEHIPFISYPYEWSFSQLKNAALLTLAVQKRAMECGMVLKDASAYNVQFRAGRPILIDTLSFEEFREGETWVAYRQFCQHFLGPLALMSRTDIRLNQLLWTNIDGIPLDLASALLPRRTLLNFSLLIHIHLHAQAQRLFAGRSKMPERRIGRGSMQALIDSLEGAVESQRWDPKGTEWSDYYADTNYSATGLEQKKRLVADFIDLVQPAAAWDLGANTGCFSRLISDRGIPVIAFDIDPGCVERNYLDCCQRGDTKILPLLMDLTNPSPSLGWMNRERPSLLERGRGDFVLALALIHHLAISNNIPMPQIAEFFHRICKWLVIEFVPKWDSQVGRLLLARADIFEKYNKDGFEAAFRAFFSIERSERIVESERTLYLMRNLREA